MQDLQYRRDGKRTERRLRTKTTAADHRFPGSAFSIFTQWAWTAMSRSTFAHEHVFGQSMVVIPSDHNTLPGILAEIAEIAGVAAALVVAREKGGRRVYFPANPSGDHWLVLALGQDVASQICAHLVAGKTGVELAVPLGPTGSRAKVWSIIQQALDSGATVGDAARIAGVDERTIRRHRNGHSGAAQRDPDQFDLF